MVQKTHLTPSYWSKLRQDKPGCRKSFFQDIVDLSSQLLKILLHEYFEERISHNNCRVEPSYYIMLFLPHLYNSDSLLENINSQEVEAI